MVDRQVGAGAARAEAGGIGCRGRRIDAAEQLAIAADVADRIDARGAMLAAPAHDLGGERELALVAEGAARGGMGGRE